MTETDMKSMDHTRLLVDPGSHVQLSDYDPGFTCGYKNKHTAKEKLESDIKELAELQGIFYAQRQSALLIILQGIDTAGKDGVIKHVMSGINPQGVDVTSFKTPSAKALAHDYLWRCTTALPDRGRFGIFNRSYYEEVIVVRVHTSLLEQEHIPNRSPLPQLWRERFEDIRAFERHLTRNGTIILKFFLNLSKEEQVKRLLQRIDMPEKNWKLSASDIHERTFWDSYQHTYEEMLAHTGSEAAPWYVIPADHGWFTRAAVADIILAKLRSLALTYPKSSDKQKALLATERQELIKPAISEPTAIYATSNHRSHG